MGLGTPCILCRSADICTQLMLTQGWGQMRSMVQLPGSVMPRLSNAAHSSFSLIASKPVAAQDTRRLTRLRATRVVVHSLTAASHTDLAAIARRRRHVVRDLAVLRAQLAPGPERLVPRPMRAAAATAAPELPIRGAHACCKTCSKNIGAYL